jgi:CBS domain-containing protein
MKTVGDVIKKKGNRIWSVTPSMTVYDTLKLMADKEIGAVLVLDEGQPVGTF